MIGKRSIATAAVGLFLLAGCDDKSKSSSTSTTQQNGSTPDSLTTTQPKETRPAMPVAAHIAADAPATRPSEPPHSTFFVADGRTTQPLAYNFPRARLHIDREEKTAVLYSDDPKNAIDAKYVGNGYYMVIHLTDEVLQHLDGYQWHFKAASSEHQDSADGIFLEGQRYHLQPSEMVVTFTGESPLVNVLVEGTFYEFDMSQSTHEGMLVEVKGWVSAFVDAPK